MTLADRFRGSLLGLAIGDALGHPTTFVASLDALRARWGPRGVSTFVPAGKHPAGSVTDDTQMAIAVARAIARTGARSVDGTLEALGGELVAWSRSPLNNRAPSPTCIAACRNLARGVPWRDAGVKGSKGASGATRAAPVGLVHHRDPEALVALAAAQSAVTHAHPTAVAAAVAAAAAVAWGLGSDPLEQLLPRCRGAVAALTPAALIAVGCAPAVVEHVGTREVREALARTEAHAHTEAADPCELFGDARVAEEALACALWCVLRAAGSFPDAVLRAANSAGSSDMIASLVGAVSGARAGLAGLDPAWVAAVEGASALRALADALAAVSASGAPAPLDPVTDLFGHDRLAVRPDDDADGEDTEVDKIPDALRSFRLPTGPCAPVARKP